MPRFPDLIPHSPTLLTLTKKKKKKSTLSNSVPLKEKKNSNYVNLERCFLVSLSQICQCTVKSSEDVFGLSSFVVVSVFS